MNTEADYTEADALQEIYDWSSKKLKPWQQDALRRLVEAEDLELSSDEIAELAKLSKGCSSIKAIPPDESLFRSNSDTSENITLLSISNIQSVNALDEKAAVDFSPSGMTIIYGPNGSGKTGFTRILKQVCSSRDSESRKGILPNVLSISDKPQKATIKFKTGQEEPEVDWPNEASADIKKLSNANIFDSKTASIQVNQENVLAYSPYPLELLQRLVSTFREVKKVLEGEMEVLGTQLKNFDTEFKSQSIKTKVNEVLNDVSDNDSLQAVKNLANLSDEQYRYKNELKEFFEIDVVQGKAKYLENAEKLNEIISILSDIQNCVSQDNIDRARTLFDSYKAYERASKIAAEKFTTVDDLLPGFGGQEWKALWEAAEEYSHLAYPNEEFPVTGEGAKCVLCQQDLSAPKDERMLSFRDFVKGQTQLQMKNARIELKKYKKKLEDMLIPQEQCDKYSTFISENLKAAATANQVVEFISKTNKYISSILKDIFHSESSPKLPADVVPNLNSALEKQRIIFTDEDIKKQSGLRLELLQLEDREVLHRLIDVLVAEIQRRKKVRALQGAIGTTQHRFVSILSNTISDKLISEKLCRKFENELQNYLRSRIKLTKARNKYGMNLFKIIIVSSRQTQVERVLSEGEHRYAALAAFLAEISIYNNSSAAIFDDPTSSFDHNNRDFFAQRLAYEATQRQVIVFTHDASFVLSLNKQCSVLDYKPSHRQIYSGPLTTGLCKEGLPIKLRSFKQQIRALEHNISKVKDSYDHADIDSKIQISTSLFAQVRIIWEQAVRLFIIEVKPFDTDVVHPSNITKLVNLSYDEAQILKESYSRCCVPVHSESIDMNSTPPDFDDFNSELIALRKWNDILRRQEQL